jgi:hypothetical protein
MGLGYIMIYPIGITYPNLSYLNIWLWYGIGMWYGIVYWDNDMIPIMIWFQYDCDMGLGCDIIGIIWEIWSVMGYIPLICDLNIPSEKPDISHSHSNFHMSNILNHVTNDQKEFLFLNILRMIFSMPKYFLSEGSLPVWNSGSTFYSDEFRSLGFFRGWHNQLVNCRGSQWIGQSMAGMMDSRKRIYGYGSKATPTSK